MQDKIADAVSVAATHSDEVDREGRFPHEAVEALRKAGLFGLAVPEDLGGIGGGPAEYLETMQQLSAACGSTAAIYMMHVCATQVVLAGKGGVDHPTTRALADGSSLGTLAFSERGSRSHFWAPVSQITPEGAFDCEKSFTTSAGYADIYVVSTRPNGSEVLESSLYAVSSTDHGIEIGKAWDGLGMRGNASAPMRITSSVPAAGLLGETGKGLDLMLGVVLPWFQLGQGGLSLGLAQGSLRAATAHVTGARLEHLGQSLADLPTIRARMGRAQIDVQVLEGFLRDLARRMAEGDAEAPVLAAKAAANETAISVTSEVMQMCGGAAISRALPMERYFRDARAGSVMAPTTDVLWELTGRAMAGMPLL